MKIQQTTWQKWQYKSHWCASALTFPSNILQNIYSVLVQEWQHHSKEQRIDLIRKKIWKKNPWKTSWAVWAASCFALAPKDGVEERHQWQAALKAECFTRDKRRTVMDHVLIKSVQTNLWSLTETDTKEEKNDLFVSDCSFSASVSYNELYTFLFKKKKKIFITDGSLTRCIITHQLCSELLT